MPDAEAIKVPSGFVGVCVLMSCSSCCPAVCLVHLYSFLCGDAMLCW